MRTLARYELLADLFEYPNKAFPKKVLAVRDYLATDYSEASKNLNEFLALLPADDEVAMQELFTRSFDVQAATTLDIGYVLFGDDYKRGEMLSNLNREHRLVGNDCGFELSDHLPNLLRLLNKMTDQELLEELVGEVIAPALKMMVAEFIPERMENKKKSYKKHYKTIIEQPRILGAEQLKGATLYQYPIIALALVLKQDFNYVEKEKPKFTSDFLKSVTGENEIEDKSSQLY